MSDAGDTVKSRTHLEANQVLKLLLEFLKTLTSNKSEFFCLFLFKVMHPRGSEWVLWNTRLTLEMSPFYVLGSKARRRVFAAD